MAAPWALDVVTAMGRAGDAVAFRHPSVSGGGGSSTVRTHAESRARAARLAQALVAHGIRPRDRVALVVESTADAVEAYLAVGLAGATAVQVNDRLQVAEIAEVLDAAAPRAVVHTAGHAGRLEDMLAGAGTDVVSLGGRLGCTTLDADAAAQQGPASPPEVTVDPGAAAIVGFTSGTTGRPKGVVHSQANLRRIVRHMPVHDGLRWGSRCAFTGTLAFAAGIWGVVLPHLWVGGELSFMAGLPPDAWVERMVAERTNFTYAPTPLMGALAAEVRRRPEVLDHLDGVLHSGSIAPRESVVDLVSAIGHRYVETYGMTETGAPVTATVPDDWRPGSTADDPFASAGRAVSIARLEIHGPDGRLLGPGEVGEVVVDSDTLFDGYLDAPELTAEAVRDGSLHTGDLGSLDVAGHLYVRGRSKEMIVTGGMNVYPAEVERVMAQAHGVAEVAVFGLPDERWGETVVAAVVARPGADLDLDALRDHVRERMAGYKKPTRIHVVDELPRNASLKVRKDELQRRFGGAR
ncbi:class I adenylate-forming enzyme family protein [Humibacillus xanthopallidus]|uniref:Fatty-acyl-CoA synthase n=1 Tax=Humibacillus xanthopallidus TaxID=412689 RepID=A0A543HVI0_9MICO|nr:AMP-binding protein [Humibacillus xanthopallidus]TQM62249.1 fatty-acyl-CoA synthase [Humibacillus xanthopallidus]